MSLSLEQELQSIHDELARISIVFAQVQDRIVQVTRRSEDETNYWQATMIELEERNAEVVNNMKWLSEQNRELERRFQQKQPDLERALDARGAAFRKLRYARKVIRDLVDENERLQVTSGGPELALTEDEEQQEKRNALNEALAFNDDSSDSDSEGTARQSPRETHHARPSSLPGVRTADTPTDPEREASPDSSSESIHRPVPASTSQMSDGTGDQISNIHYSSPPRSSSMTFGPVSYRRLLDYSIVQNQTLAALEDLESRTELGLRLYASNDLAFVHDPIFLEGNATTYILDWGSEKFNANLEKYISSVKHHLHVFTFPVKMNKWYYVGAHTWKVVKLDWLVWPTLRKKSRKNVAEKLSERSHQALSVQEITELLDKGELRQFCVEISSHGHRAKSETFGERMGYGEHPTTEA
ncbi:hypothetical protein Hypma_009985 [Hypsizygus marmoreus]|uniref:Uncharacterized protein n=1 Tax=Hypsizygus marmoreus TaxID=39966 RepID=A0A369JVL1_HYPMA|nr:hypothetical protein Hypma_009985 [Hypsizygus marmoreus]